MHHPESDPTAVEPDDIAAPSPEVEQTVPREEDTPDDYVIGTGKTWAVRHFCETAFSAVGLDYREHVVVDEKFLRPAEERLRFVALHSPALRGTRCRNPQLIAIS